MLTGAVVSQGMKAIAWRKADIVERFCSIEQP
jgi:hypothetical protein